MARTDAAAPSREQLQMAYRHMARPGWPNSLDEALAKPSYRTAIHGLARNLGRRTFAQGTAHRTSLPTAPAPPTPDQAALARNGTKPLGSIARGPATALSVWPARATFSTPGTHDCKRAAANDRDD